MFRIKMMSGDTLKITEEEYTTVVARKLTGLTHFKSLGGAINLNSVETILPKDCVDQLDKENQTEGYLHDGSFVIKKFGFWKDPQNPEITFDKNYYKDEVATKSEWDEIKRLGINYYKYLAEKRNPLMIIDGSQITNSEEYKKLCEK